MDKLQIERYIVTICFDFDIIWLVAALWLGVVTFMEKYSQSDDASHCEHA